MASIALTLCSGLLAQEPVQIEIDTGYAEETLLVFARETGLRIVFNKRQLKGIETAKVSGEMDPTDALKQMLNNTGLMFDQDAEIGAIAVVLKPKSYKSLSTKQTGCNPIVSNNSNPTQHNDTTMKKKNSLLGKFFKGLLGIAIASSSASVPIHGQEEEVDENVYEMSPFEIISDSDDGYMATETLAGARVRTSLKDVASAISVVTEEFMKNTGATDNMTLLQYTPNTEVGGLNGNYAGVGNTFISGISESGASLINPNSNTRVRGLDSADNTRNYFQTDIPWDGYIIDRVDLQRGPNSILFGIGSPAGIIDASPNAAVFEDLFELENRIGSYDSIRTSMDFNKVIIEDELMIRVALLDNDQKYRQKPAYSHDQRFYSALRWEPDLFGIDSMHTSFRANFEHGNVTSNNPRVLPPEDRMEGFFAEDGFNGAVWDGPYVESSGIRQFLSGSTIIPGETANYWIQQFEVGVVDGPLFIYDNFTSPSSPIDVFQNNMMMYFGLAADGTRDGEIKGLSQFVSGLGGYGAYARTKNARLGNVSGVEAADKGFYKNNSISDPTVFDFFNHLIDGPNKIEKQSWDAYNVALSQSFLNNRIALETVFDRQEYWSFREGNLSSPFISIDVNANQRGDNWNTTGVKSYDGTGTPGTNPHAGKAYTGSMGGGSESQSVRESLRLTATGEIRADDFLKEDSWLSRLIGRHVVTGLYSKNTLDFYSRDWFLYGVDLAYGDVLGFGGGGNPEFGNNTNTDFAGSRKAGWKIYMSDSVLGRTSASGLNLQPITTKQNPSGPHSVRYFDSHWKWSMDPNAFDYIDPGALYIRDNIANPNISSEDTQSENPDNYVGWRSIGTTLLNASEGDRDLLTTDASKIQKATESQAFTWQGYLWDDTVVTTFGWRRDRQEQRSGVGKQSATNGAAATNFNLDPLDPDLGIAEGETISWGVVAHTPYQFRDKLPLGTNISVFYDEGKNTRVENRYGFDGEVLPNAKGNTKDYGIVINTLNDRLQLKLTWYETTVRDANIASVTTSGSTLGSYQYELSSLEAWGTASALMILGGYDGNSPWQGWYWNYANTDDPEAVPDSGDNTSEAFLNHPSTITQRAAVESWLSQMWPQEWYDAFKIPIDVDLAAAGDYVNAVEGWSGATGYVTGVNPEGGNKVNGVFPTGTVDNQSKGVEIELTGRITDNWNITINASKQEASQIAVGTALSDFIQKQYDKFQTPAGDLRLWYAGDMTLREYYDRGVWAAYQFQKQTNGKLVPEMSPWRANMVSNFMFKDGILRGLNFGGSYRWQQGVVLGYGLNEAKDNLDVDNPIWGDDQDAIDLWVGYQRQLTDKIHWRVQLNVRNVGEDPHLIPISVQPNGNPANYRIQDGQTWFLTNTFSF